MSSHDIIETISRRVPILIKIATLQVKGDLREALQLTYLASRLTTNTRDDNWLVNVNMDRGFIYAKSGDITRAYHSFRRAIKLAIDPMEKLTCIACMVLYLREDNRPRMLNYWVKRALRLADQTEGGLQYLQQTVIGLYLEKNVRGDE